MYSSYGEAEGPPGQQAGYSGYSGGYAGGQDAPAGWQDYSAGAGPSSGMSQGYDGSWGPAQAPAQQYAADGAGLPAPYALPPGAEQPAAAKQQTRPQPGFERVDDWE